MIINQVRGEECCGKGSLENLELQLKTTARLGLPATYAVRYDALTNATYVQLLKKYQATYPDLIDIGVMVEVMPSLTEAANVSYRGTNDSWYQAHHAFTIGYPDAARKKLVDTLLLKYKTVFGTYPRVSSAWMIDTESLNYLKATYGIQYHQITREQWGTDSYTLYGGPPHYPYPASKNWLMVPDFTAQDPIWIVRQTVTDPIYNYGDATSTYTSQPNDYARAGKNIDYFKKLVSQAFDTRINPLGFACIGLENSMESAYQQEYVRQLEWVAEQYEQVRLMAVPVTALSAIFHEHPVTSYSGVEGDVQVSWITAPTYRIRVVKKGEEISITDIRVYSPELTDPYNEVVAKHEGYWIVPFLLDGSRWHDTTYHTYGINLHEFIPVYYDVVSGSTRLVVDAHATTPAYAIAQDAYDEVALRISEKSMQFTPTGIEMDGFSQQPEYKPYVPQAFPIKRDGTKFEWQWEDEKLFSMKSDSSKNKSTVTFDTAKIGRWNDLRFVFYPYAYPETVGRTISQRYSRITVSNAFAIAGRNPVRLILEPHDAMNFPILLDEEARITTVPEGIQINRLGELRKSQHQYVDIVSQTPVKVNASIQFSQGGVDISKTVTVYLSPNCKQDVLYCVLHPIQGSWYIYTKLSDWWNVRK
ncbi:MAG: hypothetical protein WCJ70_03880 [bacterium]